MDNDRVISVTQNKFYNEEAVEHEERDEAINLFVYETIELP